MKTNVMLGLATVALAASVQAQFTLTEGDSGMGVTLPELGTGFATNKFITLPGDGKLLLDLNVRFDIGAAGGNTAWNGDLYAQLTHVDLLGNMQMAVLLNRVGRGQGGLFDAYGYGPNGFSITLDDQAANDVHWYDSFSPVFNGAGQLTGTWQPDGRLLDPDAPPSSFAAGLREAPLNLFTGKSAEGLWSLFLYDASGGYVAQLHEWQMDFLILPEPSVSALLGLGLLTGLGWAWRVRSRRNK